MLPKNHDGVVREGGEFSPLLRGICACAVAKQVSSKLGAGENVSVGGVWGASGALIIAALTEQLKDKSFLIVTSGPDIADSEAADLETFLGAEGGRAVIPFPAWDILPEEAEEPDIDVLSARLSFLREFGRGIRVGITPVDALLQPVPPPEVLDRNTRKLTPGTKLDLTAFVEWLGENRYRRETTVSTPGEFAVRGGVIDVWPLFGSGHGNRPVRIELADDIVESLRTFDPAAQRSIEIITEVSMGGEPSSSVPAQTTPMTAHLDAANTVIVLKDSADIEEAPGVKELLSGWKGTILRTSEVLEEGAVDAGVRSVERYSGHPEALATAEGAVLLFSPSAGASSRLKKHVEGSSKRTEGIQYLKGFLSGGFTWPEPKLTFLSEAEVMNRPRVLRRAAAPIPSRKLVDILELSPGDYVVHVTHGIARYLGIERLDIRGRTEEYLALQFAEQAKVYVPLAQMYLVQKYVGSREEPPDLSQIGTNRWSRRKQRVLEAARDIAAELLETHAKRKSYPGIPYPPDDALQEEFEAAFAYQDTPDQEKAGTEIKQDMEAPHPMERLLCGDVGFGKTEIAIRAVFKAVSAGRQAAVLVPTTILAEQHLRTFRDRLEPFGVTVEMLNRYKTPKEQETIIQSLKEGRIDAVIGTSRLIQEDVAMRRLGLLIIDEEQRFGVAQKERLKKMYPAVDVLMLSATPIPRTLHMALAGIRDISTLATPPPERYSIRTAVIKKSLEVIRRAILRELSRGGQVFYLHNRVQTLDVVAKELAAIVPEARIITVHGQMKDRELARNMHKFLSRETDVLVSTSIVESGLDIPTVNTILIDDPERYGLSELHQLRGRVGRYHERAYCYLLVPEHSSLGTKARRRLKAIEELQHLGAGFDIAVRDMELRGIGNLLGSEQSGHIAEVGYELYMDLLSRAVKELKGEKVREPIEVTVHLTDASYIPDSYIPDTPVRIDAYRAVSTAENRKTLAKLQEEFRDRFGKPPRQVENLFAEAELSMLSRRARVLYLGVQNGRLTMRFDKLSIDKLEHKWEDLKPDVRFPDDRTVTVGLPQGLTPVELARRLLQRLA